MRAIQGKVAIMADLNTMESRTEFEEQKILAWDLQNRIEDSNSEVVGQRHQFSFDKVFNPEESQEEVFAEISQLVQNVVDGHKVLDLRTLTWSRVEAKVRLRGLCGIIISKCLWPHVLWSFLVKAFDPLAYTWSILKTYGKAPIFDLPLLLKGKAANNFLSDKKGNSKEFL
ncbi:hypothetical protein Syun_021072 [Stephania yunnanensis]|uniref:Spindle pole body-associated protein Vik1/Cik1 microtubule binding domain-containing protein n=1 Tax=Stephania yunnanensis TaxID=152371 RepID=A0AAP0IFE3_9MAGN